MAGRRSACGSASSSAPGSRCSTWSAIGSGNSAAATLPSAPEPFTAKTDHLRASPSAASTISTPTRSCPTPTRAIRSAAAGTGRATSAWIPGQPLPNTEARRRSDPRALGQLHADGLRPDRPRLGAALPVRRHLRPGLARQRLPVPAGGLRRALLPGGARGPADRLPARAARRCSPAATSRRTAARASACRRSSVPVVFFRKRREPEHQQAVLDTIADRAGPRPRAPDLARERAARSATCSRWRRCWSATCHGRGGERASFGKTYYPSIDALVRRTVPRGRGGARERAPVAILGCGMMTGVGLTAEASCAAIRGASTTSGRPASSPAAATGSSARGAARGALARHRRSSRACSPARCANAWTLIPDVPPESIPVLLCVAEEDRPGRLEGLGRSPVLRGLRSCSDVRFHDSRASIAAGPGRRRGRARITPAGMIHEEGFRHVIVAGVDSYLRRRDASRLRRPRAAADARRTRTASSPAKPAPRCWSAQPDAGRGLRSASASASPIEKATIESEEPLRADGLVAAATSRRSTAPASTMARDRLPHRRHLSGEQYCVQGGRPRGSRASCAIAHEFQDLWHPADCVGETGAAAMPVHARRRPHGRAQGLRRRRSGARPR